MNIRIFFPFFLFFFLWGDEFQERNVSRFLSDIANVLIADEKGPPSGLFFYHEKIDLKVKTFMALYLSCGVVGSLEAADPKSLPDPALEMASNSFCCIKRFWRCWRKTAMAAIINSKLQIVEEDELIVYVTT